MMQSASGSTPPGKWVEKYADVLYRYAISRVGREHLAEDLVQDTLLAAMQSQSTFRGDSQEQTWLIGILRHKVLDHFRSVQTQRETSVSQDDDGARLLDHLFDEKGRWRKPPGDWQVDGHQLMENAEFWGIFRQCMDRLPERPRQVFASRVMDEKNTDEICKELSISSTNLWVILHRARALLRTCLEMHWFGQSQIKTNNR